MQGHDLLHAIVMGSLIGGVYWAVITQTNWIRGKPVGRRILVLVPIYMVLVFVFNQIWYYGS